MQDVKAGYLRDPGGILIELVELPRSRSVIPAVQIVRMVAPVAEGVGPALLADLVLPERVAMAAVSPCRLRPGWAYCWLDGPVL